MKEEQRGIVKVPEMERNECSAMAPAFVVRQSLVVQADFEWQVVLLSLQSRVQLRHLGRHVLLACVS